MTNSDAVTRTVRPVVHIIDELGFVPLSTTGAELLFKVFSQHYERGSVLVTTLPQSRLGIRELKACGSPFSIMVLTAAISVNQVRASR